MEASNKKNNEVIQTDSGQSWIVLIGSFFIINIVGCILFSYWFFYHQIISERFNSATHIRFIFPFLGSICFMTAPLSSLLINFFGFRVVTIFGSLLAGSSMLVNNIIQDDLILIIITALGIGIGLGFMYLSAISSVTTHFEKFRPLAIGLLVSGFGATTIFVPFMQFLEENFGRSVVMIGCTLAVYSCSIFGLLLKPINLKQSINSNKETNSRENKVTKLITTMTSLINNPFYLIFCILWICFNIAIVISNYNFYKSDIWNISDWPHKYLMMVLTLSNVVGRITFGFICNLPVIRHGIFSSCIIGVGIATVLSNYCISFNMIISCLIVVFVLTGGSVGMISVVMVDLVGLKNFTVAFSVLLFFQGVIFMVGHYIIDLLQYNSKESLLIYFGTTCVICGFASFAILFQKHKQKIKKNYMERL